MITIGLTVINFVKNLTPKGWLVVVLLAVAVLALGTCAVQKVTDHFDRNNAVKVNNEDRELREDLSVKRQETEQAITSNERVLNEALNKLPDDVPSARRIARACHELRNDGHVVLPAECGPPEGGQGPG